MKDMAKGYFDKLLESTDNKFKITGEDYKIQFRKKQKYKLEDILEITKK